MSTPESLRAQAENDLGEKEGPEIDLAELHSMVENRNLPERIEAIQILGEIGDAESLKTLRLKLNMVNQELYALVVAVGKLKRRLNVR